MKDTCRTLCSEAAWCSAHAHRGRPGRTSHTCTGPPPSPDRGNSYLGDSQTDTCGCDTPEFDHSSGHMEGSYQGNTSSCTGVSGSFWFLDIWSHTGILCDTTSTSCIYHTCTPSPPPVCRSRSSLGDTSLNRCVFHMTDGGRTCHRTATLPPCTAETTWSCHRDRFC